MNYNPQIHHRRSIRLKGYDYSLEGAYFITINCHGMQRRFGHVVKNSDEPAKMILNEYGEVAYNEWVKLPERFSHFELDVFQIMPNHIHGIIVLNESPNVQAICQLADAHPPPSPEFKNSNEADTPGAGASPAPTVGDIVGAYKSLVATTCLEIFKSKNDVMGKLWQRNFYEHIIRDRDSYQAISNYIINNPENWKADKFYIE